MADLYELASTLPTKPQTKAQVDMLVKQHGFATIQTRLLEAHQSQCGPACAHQRAPVAAGELPL